MAELILKDYFTNNKFYYKLRDVPEDLSDCIGVPRHLRKFLCQENHQGILKFFRNWLDENEIVVEFFDFKTTGVYSIDPHNQEELILHRPFKYCNTMDDFFTILLMRFPRDEDRVLYHLRWDRD